MDDFERRRELRRQKREEMRLEAERIAYQRNDDDEEEAARERRRRARQERLRQKQEEESLGQVTDQVETHAQNSVPDEESKPATTNTQIEGDEEAALLERLARREERRQKRLQEALERQKEFDPTVEEMVEEKTPETQEEAVVMVLENGQIKDEKIQKDKEPKEEVKSFLDRKKGFTEVKAQNGEFMTHKLKQTENAFSPSRPGCRAGGDKEAEGAPQVEAGKRLEELRRRRGETESEEFEKLKQKQQEAALELEELKKKREERRKVLEEEEQRRKQEEADRKAREEEEKKRLKEEIEKRRAEAAEKRQKMPEDGLSEDKKPFKCFTPKGSSLKIEERAEFLNKSVQKSGVKSTHQAAVVSKIDSRLEQYTNAIEGTKTSKPTKPAASDLPVPAEGVRSIKSMWEKGNVFSSPSASGTPNKETAGLKVGVSSRINEWLTKSPDGNKSPAPKPSDLRPGDVSGKRNLWEKQSVDKVTSPTKVDCFVDFFGSDSSLNHI
ncbi:caldesmon 1 [Cricetulus griseus]